MADFHPWRIDRDLTVDFEPGKSHFVGPRNTSTKATQECHREAQKTISHGQQAPLSRQLVPTRITPEACDDVALWHLFSRHTAVKSVDFPLVIQSCWHILEEAGSLFDVHILDKNNSRPVTLQSLAELRVVPMPSRSPRR